VLALVVFLKLMKLREEVRAMLRECLRFYGNIVLNCPLAFTGRGTTDRYIRQLELTKVVDKDEPPDKRCFLWEWSFEFSDRSSLTLTHTYSYPSLSWNGSVPSTAVFGF